MKILSLMLSLNIFFVPGYSQLKSIPVSKIALLQDKNLRCLDTSGMVSKLCPLGLDGFNVIFFNAYLDKIKMEVRLIGRVCTSGGMSTGGLPDIEIFKAAKEGNKLTGRSLISRTTYDKEFIYNDGFFDITIAIKKGESLFFYNHRYFLKEFTISKLLQ